MERAGIFGGMGSAKVAGGGRYIEPAKWHLEARELKVFESQRKRGQWFFAAEFDVLDVKAPADYEGKFPFAPGDLVSWLVNMDNDSSLGNIKGLAMALVPGSEEEDIDDAAMEGLVDSSQPARGLKVWANAFHVETRKGTPFTKVVWSSDADGIDEGED